MQVAADKEEENEEEEENQEEEENEEEEDKSRVPNWHLTQDSKRSIGTIV